MTNKRVSVVIPAYNSEKYIITCIESLLHQTYQNIEIIVVNDGSTDNTLEVLYIYKKDIIIINQSNSGVSSARNAGLKHATGDYIMFVDSDDWVEPEMISTMMKYASLNVIVRCRYVVENGLNKKAIMNGKCEIISGESILLKLILTYEFNPPYCQLIPSGLIEKMFPENISMGEDFLFNSYLYSNINKVIILHDQFYHYRKVENSLVNSKNENRILKRCDDIIYVYSSLFDILRDHKINNLYSLITFRVLKELNYQLLQLFQIQSIDKNTILYIISYYFNKVEKICRNRNIIKLLFKMQPIYVLPMLFLKKNQVNLYYYFGKLIYRPIYFLSHRRE